ncbi:MAG: GNAT family N-acetyltransferase [Balneolaceae bacterium]|nr:GNAT family N-acetyltransferase [Balneolaceae bacterium]MBO6544982.1 GNAT family N-acetyltransferase [Balneolaceae bacterium]MBO6646378.1 GNAT family N-acetyltransferase [Balneolaceae bacterium]
MTTLFCEFQELSVFQLYDLLKLRQDVFMIEQNCLYSDLDNSDQNAQHLLMYDRESLAAYLRFFAPGIKFREASLGRIVVAPKYRGKTIGKDLIKAGIKLTLELYRGVDIRIEAQSALKEYYNSLGFIEEGEIYIADEIEHLQMVYKNIT